MFNVDSHFLRSFNEVLVSHNFVGVFSDNRSSVCSGTSSAFDPFKVGAIENSVDAITQERFGRVDCFGESSRVFFCELSGVCAFRDRSNEYFRVVLMLPFIKSVRGGFPGAVGVERNNDSFGETDHSFHVVVG